MRIIQAHNPKDIESLMRQIKVDGYGIKIMTPKAVNRLIRINALSNISANILKQEMLSLGGDVAVGRDALTGKAKRTDCLVIGNLSQLKRLSEKLERQPFGLNAVAQDISRTVRDYQKDAFTLSLGSSRMSLKDKTRIMGIVNITPDSFSGDGVWGFSREEICDAAAAMVEDGADIIDIGGESTRPGARPVSVKEELARVLPVIKQLAKRLKVPLSIDTRKYQVAQAALDNGACMVNDISGLRDREMMRVVARHKCAVAIMHMRGTPRSMQNKTKYSSLIDEIIEFLSGRIQLALESGVDRNRIMIDPGIGFAKTAAQNLEILKKLREFRVLGQPVLVGPSRKSFIGKILNADPSERIQGTVAACALAAMNGAHMVRVHDVLQVSQALKIINSIENSS